MKSTSHPNDNKDDFVTKGRMSPPTMEHINTYTFLPLDHTSFKAYIERV